MTDAHPVPCLTVQDTTRPARAKEPAASVTVVGASFVDLARVGFTSHHNALDGGCERCHAVIG